MSTDLTPASDGLSALLSVELPNTSLCPTRISWPGGLNAVLVPVQECILFIVLLPSMCGFRGCTCAHALSIY